MPVLTPWVVFVVNRDKWAVPETQFHCLILDLFDEINCVLQVPTSNHSA